MLYTAKTIRVYLDQLFILYHKSVKDKKVLNKVYRHIDNICINNTNLTKFETILYKDINKKSPSKQVLI